MIPMFSFVLAVWLVWMAYCVHVTRTQLLRRANDILRALENKDVDAVKDNAERMIDLMTF